MIERNVYAGRDVIRSFALQYRIPLIDPTESLQRSVLDGKDPFMLYDSHWNELGHELVTKDVIKYIQNSDCH